MFCTITGQYSAVLEPIVHELVGVSVEFSTHWVSSAILLASNWEDRLIFILGKKNPIFQISRASSAEWVSVECQGGVERSSSSKSVVKTRNYQIFTALTPAGTSRHLVGAWFVLFTPGVKGGQVGSGGQIVLSNLRGNSLSYMKITSSLLTVSVSCWYLHFDYSVPWQGWNLNYQKVQYFKALLFPIPFCQAICIIFLISWTTPLLELVTCCCFLIVVVVFTTICWICQNYINLICLCSSPPNMPFHKPS